MPHHARTQRGDQLAEMPVPLVDLRPGYHSMRDDIDAAVARVVEAGAFIKS